MPASTAVIFDMDGVLVDTEPLHLVSTNQVLAQHGRRLTEEENVAYLGWNEVSYWGDLKRRFALPEEVPELIAERHRRLLELMSDSLPLMDGIGGLLERLRDRGLPMAVASSSEREMIDFVLDRGDLREYFSFVASGDRVSRPKPDPEIFLMAARGLDREPAACVVLEDSPNGVLAARAAGMRCFRVPTSVTEGLDFPEVDGVVASYRDLDLDHLLNHEGVGQ